MIRMCAVCGYLRYFAERKDAQGRAALACVECEARAAGATRKPPARETRECAHGAGRRRI